MQREWEGEVGYAEGSRRGEGGMHRRGRGVGGMQRSLGAGRGVCRGV